MLKYGVGSFLHSLNNLKRGNKLLTDSDSDDIGIAQ